MGLKLPPNKARWHGQVVSQEFSGGRTVSEMLEICFLWNELLWNMFKKPFTDEQLSLLIFAHFPDREESKILHNIMQCRAVYNRGALPSQDGALPAIRSHHYAQNPAGGWCAWRIVKGRGGRRSRLLFDASHDPWERLDILMEMRRVFDRCYFRSRDRMDDFAVQVAVTEATKKVKTAKRLGRLTGE